jgi:hypothetical protein
MPGACSNCRSGSSRSSDVKALRHGTRNEERLRRNPPREGGADVGTLGAASRCQEVFREFGFEVRKGRPVEAAKRLRHSVRKEQAAALDDWALVCASQGKVWDSLWLLEVSKVLDPDPWRNRMRSVLVWLGAKGLKRLAEESRTQQLPAATLVLLAGSLLWTGQTQLAVDCLLQGQQQRFQDDFFTIALLGDRLGSGCLYFASPADSVT